MVSFDVLRSHLMYLGLFRCIQVSFDVFRFLLTHNKSLNAVSFGVNSMGGRYLEQVTLKTCKQICLFMYQYVVARSKGALGVDSIESSSLQARKIENAYINIDIYVSIYSDTEFRLWWSLLMYLGLF